MASDGSESLGNERDPVVKVRQENEREMSVQPGKGILSKSLKFMKKKDRSSI